MRRTTTGGCQCGKVRYTARIDDDDAYLCHCRMCQRATGGVSIAYKNVADADLTWDGEPDWYASSVIARRPFCAACGTPLGFAFAEGGTHTDLTVGSFDDPAPFRPTRHYAVESMHAAWIDTHALPMMRSEENEAVAGRWRAAGLTPPD